MKQLPTGVFAGAVLAAIFFVAGKFGLLISHLNPGAFLFSPAAGIALAALLLGGLRFWPAILIGTFLVNVTVPDSRVFGGGMIARAALLAGGSTLEALIGAWLVERYAGGARAFDRAATTFRFAFFTAAVCVIGASVGTLVIALVGQPKPHHYGPFWFGSWMGNAISMWTVAPLVLIWRSWPERSLMRRELIEAGALAAAVVIVSVMVFLGWPSPDATGFALTFFIFPVLLWAAARFGSRGVVLAAATISAGAVAGIGAGNGPLTSGSEHSPLVLLQAFIAIATLTALALAAALSESGRAEAALRRKDEQHARLFTLNVTDRRRAEEEVRRLNAELEERVRSRTTQLEATNKELEAFCYSVSHDLRAPLRTIRGFGEVLLDLYAPQLDARGQEFLRRVCTASDQMDRLIDDLLKLSRVSRADLRFADIDLSAMANEIAQELANSDRSRSVDFVIAPGCIGQGDVRLVRQVMENLLRNAWKFTGKRPDARIEFGPAPEAEDAFFVRDNGAGFDMTYAGKLFGVFQRLHNASEFPGTGVGLAIVQRIVHRHAGRVWATGKTGEGATFFFTLPAPEDSPKVTRSMSRPVAEALQLEPVLAGEEVV